MFKIITFLLVFTVFSVKAQQLIHSIQEGLIPSIVLEKDTGKTYKVEKRMAFYKVQGLSIVAFENGKITQSKHFGLAKADRNETVTLNTRFQVASISKTITSLGVLKLTEMYQLDLDKDINQYLKSWKIPDYENTTESKVSIRSLLNHTAGINVEGFEGYFQTQKIPTLLEVLNGSGTSPKIEVVIKPQTKFSYSGGGYVILAKLIEDVSGKSFEEFMQKTIFQPLQMKNSSFHQFPTQNYSFGYDQDGVMVASGWKIMPELAPNGLWTTAHDLALFCMSIQNAYEGKKKGVVSKKWIDQLLQKSTYMDYGLGVGLKMDNENQYFFHAGQNSGGYTGVIISNLKRQNGLVVLTNSEDNHLLREIVNGYAKANNLGFAKGLTGPQEVVKTINLSEQELTEYEGTYHNEAQKELEVSMIKNNDNSLSMNYLYNGYTAILHPIKKDTFYEIYTGLEITFTRNASTNRIETVERRGKMFLKK
jgi:CubicO group peptidase (beta-lactamase class C family)